MPESFESLQISNDEVQYWSNLLDSQLPPDSKRIREPREVSLLKQLGSYFVFNAASFQAMGAASCAAHGFYIPYNYIHEQPNDNA